MPQASVWLVRGALLNFVFGVSIGTLLLIGKAIMLPAELWMLRPLHVETLFFGFMVQLAFGIAFWILPRRGIDPSPRALVGAAVLLNVGVWLTGVGAGVQVSGLELAGRLTEFGAIGAFARGMWPRVQGLRAA